MADREQPRSIRLPSRLWDVIDRDAVRCGRSAVKQLEVLLSAYYGLRNVELDYERLSALQGNYPTLKSESPLTMKVLKTERGETKKGRMKKAI